jgi:hypothetical protein
LVVWELLKTVSLLKSELTNDKIKPKKLTNTKKNCRKDIKKILLSIFLFIKLKFFIETGIIKNPKIKLKIKE